MSRKLKSTSHMQTAYGASRRVPLPQSFGKIGNSMKIGVQACVWQDGRHE